MVCDWWYSYIFSIDGLICSHFNTIFGFIIRCNSFFHIANVVILASSACLRTVESLFSAATSETTRACGTVTVNHFQECRMQGDLHTISYAHPHLHLEIAPQKVKFRGGDCSNKEDSLSNQANKQPLIRLISERMRERGCHVIQAKEDADVDIVKAAVSMASSKTTTLIGEDTDLLVLLLQYTPNNNVIKIYVLPLR